MPKLKTNKAVRKRFKVTGTGKVMSGRTKRRHLLGDRNPTKKRKSRKRVALGRANQQAVIQSMPYG